MDEQMHQFQCHRCRGGGAQMIVLNEEDEERLIANTLKASREGLDHICKGHPHALCTHLFEHFFD